MEDIINGFYYCWTDLVGMDNDVSRNIADEVIEKYSQPGRAYHNLIHVNELLAEVSKCEELIKEPQKVKLAVWFHDVIYNPGRKDNESQSAEFAKRNLSKLGFLNMFCQDVADLIMDTTHKEKPKTKDGLCLADADLAILGANPDRYMEYARQIREEYSDVVDEESYKKGRSNVMQSFLDRKHIYHTKFFRQIYETRARENIKREIALLNQ